MSEHDRPAEQPAVKTTIVGGRPPGPGKPLGPIPRGIEVLIKKAAVDPAFRRLLLETRDEAAREIDLVLEPAEALMLRAAPREQLQAIIDRTRVHPKLRSAFLGRAAAVMLVALGAGAIGCPAGIGPDRPAAEEVEPPATEEATEITPAIPTPLPERMAGIQSAAPERVEPPPAEEATKSTPPEAAPRSHGVAGIQPAAPEQVEPTEGIRPDRPPAKEDEPPPPVQGIRPDRPPDTKGIRPDRPPSAARPDADEGAAAPRATAVEPTASTPTSDAMTLGIRPDRPPITPGVPPGHMPAAGGARPDRPKPATGDTATGETATDEQAEPAVVTLAVPAEWTEQDALRAFARGLKHLSAKLLPKHTFTFKDGEDGRIHIAWKTQEYRLTVPSNKAGDTKVRDVTGPAADGLILTVWIAKDKGQAVRPQALDHDGKWKTDLKQVQLLPLKTNLMFNLDYGAEAKKDLLGTFASPQVWYRYHTAPDPSEPVTRGIRPDRPGGGTFGIQPDRPQ